jgi:hypothetical protein
MKDFLKSGALGVVPALMSGSKLVGGLTPSVRLSMLNEQRDDIKAIRDTLEKQNRTSSPEIKAPTIGMKKGGSVKSSASKRADGIAQRGKTKGRMI